MALLRAIFAAAGPTLDVGVLAVLIRRRTGESWPPVRIHATLRALLTAGELTLGGE